MEKNDRFQLIEKQGNALSDFQYSILLDTVTDVQYLFVQSGNAGGLCPLMNRDGDPVTGET